MNGMNRLLLDVIEIDLGWPGDIRTVYLNVYDNSLSRKWLQALNDLIEKNYPKAMLADYHLGQMYEKTGDTKRAIKSY